MLGAAQKGRRIAVTARRSVCSSVRRLHLFYQHRAKRKDIRKDVLLFWAPAAKGRFRLSEIQMFRGGKTAPSPC